MECLTRKAYPDASSDLQDILAKDHFIDASYEEVLRLRVRQARPPSLQVALETALELESFQLASRHRNTGVSGSSWECQTSGGDWGRVTLKSGRGKMRVQVGGIK